MSFSYKPLWRILLEKDMTKTELRELLGLSSSTLAKMGKDEYVSLEIIDKICGHFGVQPNDIMEHKGE
jgi:DNA-binding Xre family transcriptional regulator